MTSKLPINLNALLRQRSAPRGTQFFIGQYDVSPNSHICNMIPQSGFGSSPFGRARNMTQAFAIPTVQLTNLQPPRQPPEHACSSNIQPHAAARCFLHAVPRLRDAIPPSESVTTPTVAQPDSIPDLRQSSCRKLNHPGNLRHLSSKSPTPSANVYKVCDHPPLRKL